MNIKSRYRLIYGTAFILTIALGLFSRSNIVPMPDFVTLYVGDSLWALMVFWCVCLLSPGWKPVWQIVLSIISSYAVEFSQLYQSQWVNEIRSTKLGALILGFVFKASDLIAYIIGIGTGAVINCFINYYLKSREIQ